MNRVFRLAAALLPLLVSAEAWACAVCGQNRDDAIGRAFVQSTVIMSLVPVGAVGATIAFFVRSAIKRRSAELAQKTETSAP